MAVKGKAAVLLAGAMLAISMIAPAWAQDADADADRGKILAERHCARCHAIGPADASPREGVPPFRTFAEKWPLEHLEEAFGEGIMVGHPEMPEFVFDPAEIADLLAFIGAIKP